MTQQHHHSLLSRSLTPLKPGGTLIAVIEMSLSSWLVAGIVPGVERQPSKKLEVDENTFEHRRAKTDRLDTELLKRSFLGWLRASVITARWSRSRQS
jgi:hypothetical protein